MCIIKNIKIVNLVRIYSRTKPRIQISHCLTFSNLFPSLGRGRSGIEVINFLKLCLVVLLQKYISLIYSLSSLYIYIYGSLTNCGILTSLLGSVRWASKVPYWKISQATVKYPFIDFSWLKNRLLRLLRYKNIPILIRNPILSRITVNLSIPAV